MLIYLDMCCLKRPFDDQSHPRIRLESEALLSLLALESEAIQFVRSAALHLENSLNPIAERAAKVEAWLKAKPLWHASDGAVLQARITTLMALGLKSFDALHVASADLAGADYFVTCDDRLLTLAKRNQKQIRPQALGLVECGQELIK
jgi:predicted nucleic acid-binding protein